ncbi:MAG: alanine racemase [Acidimicrobiia bacterium]|nr:alanine racemase [Acidimicrobiia bacterium]MDH4305997.1 alanine racemase [Acidimicrobiia bacterium]MDH5292884.1 alanine racemase [Acidimicrobiia bacterium]
MNTPWLTLDLDRLDRNVNRMRDRMAGLGVSLRPHMKTAKSIDVAKRVLEPGQGITVSTLAEAEYFAAHGITDILYAVGVTPSKLGTAADLRHQGVDLQVVVDSLEAAAACVGNHRVWIEVDCDGRRGGVTPDGRALLSIAGVLGDSLAGVMTHAGGAYGCRGEVQIRAFAERERLAVTTAATVLRGAGHRCAGVSVGSTPTATFAEHLTGVTEARPGVYMFMDLFQAGIGVCDLDDIALSVTASVIGHRADGFVIDAGALALSLDRSTSQLPEDLGYGLVLGSEGRRLGVVERVTQEHGIVVPANGDVPPIGAVLSVLPNHACITAAGHESYQVMSGGERIGTWKRATGW